jgi:hypothetical protein
LVGVPYAEEDYWRVDAMRDLNGIDDQKVSYNVSTFSYKDTFQLLHRIYDERCTEFNISLSPLGSKLQALGCVLFCCQQPDVRVFYSVPKRYNASQYSDGCKALWHIDFGFVSHLRQLLDSAGELVMTNIDHGKIGV